MYRTDVLFCVFFSNILSKIVNYFEFLKKLGLSYDDDDDDDDDDT